VSKKAAALAAAELAVPEAVIPLAMVKRALEARAAPPMQSSEGVVLVPPPPHFLFTTRKQRVRVIERKGVKLVIVEPAHGVSATELFALMASAGIAVGAWEVYEWLKSIGADVSWWEHLPSEIRGTASRFSPYHGGRGGSTP
jgi:hypothetical protein